MVSMVTSIFRRTSFAVPSSSASSQASQKAVSLAVGSAFVQAPKALNISEPGFSKPDFSTASARPYSRRCIKKDPLRNKRVSLQ